MRLIVAALAAAPLVLAGALSGQAAARAATSSCPPWSPSARAPAPGSGTSVLNGIAVTGCDAWAVGNQTGEGGQPSQGLIEHWNGSWQVVPSPSPGSQSFLTGVAAASPSDIWAVGASQDPATGFSSLIEHWGGTSWTQVPART
jgi:hypothetical protein